MLGVKNALWAEDGEQHICVYRCLWGRKEGWFHVRLSELDNIFIKRRANGPMHPTASKVFWAEWTILSDVKGKVLFWFQTNSRTQRNKGNLYTEVTSNEKIGSFHFQNVKMKPFHFPLIFFLSEANNSANLIEIHETFMWCWVFVLFQQIAYNWKLCPASALHHAVQPALSSTGFFSFMHSQP